MKKHKRTTRKKNINMNRKKTRSKGGFWPFQKSNKFKEYYELTKKLKKKWLERKNDYYSFYGNYIERLNEPEDNITKKCDYIINLSSQYINKNESSYDINKIISLYESVNKTVELLKYIFNFKIERLAVDYEDLTKGNRWKNVPKDDEYNSLVNTLVNTFDEANNIISIILQKDNDSSLNELLNNFYKHSEETRKYYLYMLNKMIEDNNNNSSSFAAVGTSSI